MARKSTRDEIKDQAEVLPEDSALEDAEGPEDAEGDNGAESTESAEGPEELEGSEEYLPANELEELDEQAIQQQIAAEEERAMTALYGSAKPEDETRVLVDAGYSDDETRILDPLPDEAPVNDLTEIMQPIGYSHPVNAVVEIPTESVQRTIRRNEGHFRHGIAAAIVSILVLFGIGLGAGMYYRHVQSEKHTAEVIAENERKAQQAMEERDRAAEEAEAQRTLEATRTPRQVKFIISALEYDDSATRIPLVVTGIDFEGNEVNTEAFINAAGEGVQLSPGDYTATIPASPILANGALYSVPTNTYTVKVPDDSESVTVDQAIVLIPLAAADTTDDMVTNACNWARKDTANAAVSEANANTAAKEIEERRAREQREQQQKQLDETRAGIAQRFASDYFTNVAFPNSKDDSEILVISNWSEIAAQYVAPGTPAQSKLGKGPDPEEAYSYAVTADAVSVSGNTVVVNCTVVSTDNHEKGWTRDPYDATMTCTFNDNNKINDFTIK